MHDTSGMDASHFPGIDHRADPVSEFRSPIEVVLPVDRRHPRVREDVGIALLHLPAIREAVGLVPLLGRPILVGAKAGIVVFEECDSPVLPAVAIGRIADDPAPRLVASGVIALVVLQMKHAHEIERAAGGVQSACHGRRVPDPPPLLLGLIPVVFADGKGRTGGSVVHGNPFGVIAVDHVIAPAAIAGALELEQVTDDVAANALAGMVDVAKRAVSIGRSAVLRVFERALLRVASLALGRIEGLRVRIRERFVVAGNRPGAPVRISEISPAMRAVAVIDHNIRDRLDPILQQGHQHGPVLSQIAVAVARARNILSDCIRRYARPRTTAAAARSDRSGRAGSSRLAPPRSGTSAWFRSLETSPDARADRIPNKTLAA